MAASVCEYAAPTTPAGSCDAVAIASPEVPVAFTVRLNVWLAVDSVLSATRMVNVAVPRAVGVPDKVPPEDNVRPAGNVPEASAQV